MLALRRVDVEELIEGGGGVLQRRTAQPVDAQIKEGVALDQVVTHGGGQSGKDADGQQDGRCRLTSRNKGSKGRQGGTKGTRIQDSFRIHRTTITTVAAAGPIIREAAINYSRHTEVAFAQFSGGGRGFFAPGLSAFSKAQSS